MCSSMSEEQYSLSLSESPQSSPVLQGGNDSPQGGNDSPQGGNDSPQSKSAMLMEAIDIARDMAMYQTGIEFLLMEEQRIVNVMRIHRGEDFQESLATVRRLLEKAERLLEANSKSYSRIRDEYKVIMNQ